MNNTRIKLLALMAVTITSYGYDATTDNSQQNSQGPNSYSIQKYTLSSGGGVITGGVYSLTSSIGQVDAGQKLSGGNYEFRGGFLTGNSGNSNSDIIFKNSFEQ